MGGLPFNLSSENVVSTVQQTHLYDDWVRRAAVSLGPL